MFAALTAELLEQAAEEADEDEQHDAAAAGGGNQAEADLRFHAEVYAPNSPPSTSVLLSTRGH